VKKQITVAVVPLKIVASMVIPQILMVCVIPTTLVVHGSVSMTVPSVTAMNIVPITMIVVQMSMKTVVILKKKK